MWRLDISAADADELLDLAVDAAERSRDAHVIALALGLVAQLHERRGELDDAITNADESLRLHDSIGYTEGAISALHLLARLETKLDHREIAREHLCRGLRLGRKMQHAAAVCEALEGLAVLYHRAGDLDGAARILRAVDEERAARKLRVRPDDECALDALRTALAETRFRPGRMESIDDLVAGLLADVLDLAELTGHAAMELPQRPERSTLPGTVVDALSDRELHVLGLLASDLSGPEIASELFISLNTFRTHTKRIFTKLDVTSRRAAVSRARELGVL